jgi:hypothetical protein
MSAVVVDTYKELLTFLNRLSDAKLHHVLRHSRPDAITVEVFVPGERWEVEFVDYGDEVHVEVEIFRGGGVTGDEKTVEELFRTHAS